MDVHFSSAGMSYDDTLYNNSIDSIIIIRKMFHHITQLFRLSVRSAVCTDVCMPENLLSFRSSTKLSTKHLGEVLLFEALLIHLL